MTYNRIQRTLFSVTSLRHIAAAVSLAIFGSATALASDSSPAYNFLNITNSTRIYGLGGVNISTVADDLLTTDQNPALLGPEHSMQGAVSYMHYIGSSNFASLRFAHSVSDVSAWSAGITYFGYGSIREADAEGNLLGDFSPKDVAFSGVFSHNLGERLRGGFNIKMLYSTYAEYSAFALATDLGINYYDPDRDLSLSAVVANLGGQVKRFNDTYDRLPIDVRLGWSQSFANFPVRFSVTAWNLTQWSLPYIDPGDGSATGETGEMTKKESFGSNLFRHLVFAADLIPSEKFNIGIGYNYKTRTDMASYSRSILSGLSIGAGLNTRVCSVGVALAQPHRGATTLMFNLSLNINEF